MTAPAWLYEPANARILGVVRAGIGVAALMELAATMPRLLALSEPTAVRLPIVEPIAAAFTTAAPIVLLLWFAAGVAFAVGWHTTVTGTLLAI